MLGPSMRALAGVYRDIDLRILSSWAVVSGLLFVLATLIGIGFSSRWRLSCSANSWGSDRDFKGVSSLEVANLGLSIVDFAPYF
jgi:hypothetical protein